MKKELDQMSRDLVNIPFGEPPDTLQSVLSIMKNDLYNPATPLLSFYSHQFAGVIQSRDGHLEAMLDALRDDYNQVDVRIIDPNQLGIPHGIGQPLVDARTDEVSANPTLAAAIAKNPKEELIRLLKLQAAVPGSHVGGPSTVLFMDHQGHVTDHSKDNKVCPVP